MQVHRRAGGGRGYVFFVLFFGSDEKQISGYTEKIIIIQLRTGEHPFTTTGFGLVFFLPSLWLINKQR